MISLMLLTHNRLSVVLRCIPSLFPVMMRPDVETLILDNGSSDGTAEWLMKAQSHYPFLRVSYSTTNLGVSGGRANLLDRASGDRLVFLDSDVAATDNGWLDRLMTPLEDQAIGLCGPAGNTIPIEGGRWQWFHDLPRGFVGDTDVISGYCQAFRRDVIEKGVHLDMAYGKYWIEDSDMCLQIKALGYRIWCTGQQIGLRHTYAGSGDDGSAEEKFRYFEKKWKGKGLIQAETDNNQAPQ